MDKLQKERKLCVRVILLNTYIYNLLQQPTISW